MRTRGFEICKGYEEKDIVLPIRKTKNAVGYDIEAAEDTVIPSMWKTVIINAKKVIKGKNDFEEIKPTLVKTRN